MEDHESPAIPVEVGPVREGAAARPDSYRFTLENDGELDGDRYAETDGYKQSHLALEKAFFAQNDDPAHREKILAQLRELYNQRPIPSDHPLLNHLRESGLTDFEDMAQTVDLDLLKLEEERDREQIADLKKYYQLHNPHYTQREVRTEGELKRAEGHLDYFNREKKMNVQPEAWLDVRAHQIATQPMLEVEAIGLETAFADNANVSRVINEVLETIKSEGKRPSYREVLSHLRQTAKEKSGGDRFAVRTAEALVRQRFYRRAEEALVNFNNVSQGESTPHNQTALTAETIAMAQSLKKAVSDENGFITKGKIKKLIESLNRVSGGEEGTKRMIERLTQDKELNYLTYFFVNLALKGADRWKRTAILPVERGLGKKKIRKRKFVEAGDGRPSPVDRPTDDHRSRDDRPPAAADDSGSGENRRPIDADGGLPQPQEPAKETRETDEGLPPAPDKPPKEPGEREVSPGPTEPDDGGPPVEVANSDILAGVGVVERRVQNELTNMEHVRAYDMAKMSQSRKDRLLGWSYGFPIIGGVVRGLVHPVELIWQNGLFRSVFDQQKLRFVADIDDIIKGKMADGTIPLEVSRDLLTRALSEGEARKKSQKFLRRRWNGLKDFVKGITGFSQPTEYQYAKQWLEQELAKPENQQDPELRKMRDNFLKSYTDKGETFALVASQGNNLRDRMRASDRFVLKQAEGESRELLSQIVPKEQYAQLNSQITGCLRRYAEGSIDDKELAVRVNQLLFNTIRSLPAGVRDRYRFPELATNILNIGRKIRRNWAQYEKIWPSYHLNIIVGKSDEYVGGVRGKVESDFLTERLARRLAERQVFRGEVLGSAYALTKDAITYGGAGLVGWYGVGMINSVVRLLPNALARTIGAAVGVGGMAALKETGITLPFGLKHLHFEIGGHDFHPFMSKGRYAKEVEQVSREAAVGRIKTNGSRIRPEMERLLVSRIGARETAAKIEGLLNIRNGEMTAAQAEELMMTLAEVDARMRLSDQSGTRDLNYHVQNYIEYTEGQANEEYLRLKGQLLNGMTKLSAYQAAHPDFGGGKPLFGPTASQKGLFDRLSGLAEAQLRFSSADKKRIENWLQRAIGLTTQEVSEVINLFPALNVLAAEGDSLRLKERLLLGYTLRRGLTTGVKSALMAVAAPVIYNKTYETFNMGAGEVRELAADISARGWQGGFSKYVSDWEQVLHNFHGTPPVKVVNGHIVADITPAQAAALKVESFINPPRLNLHHTEIIDGQTIDLPASFHTGNLPGHGDYIVDIRNGHVYDMSHTHFSVDGGGNLQVVDETTGVATPAGVFFKGANIHLKTGSVVHEVKPTAPITVNNPITGKAMAVPGGTVDGQPWHAEWRFDPKTNAWDLVAIKDKGGAVQVGGHDLVLVDDAKFNPDGSIIPGSATLHSGVTFKMTAQPGPGGASSHSITGVGGQWSRWQDNVHGVKWWRNGTPGEYIKGILNGKEVKITNEARLHNSYDAATGTFQFSIRSMKDSWNKPDASDGVINVHDLIKAQASGKIDANTEVGFAFYNHGNLSDAVFRPVDGKGGFQVDVNNHSDLFGQTVINHSALSHFKSASELTGHRDVINPRYVSAVIRRTDPVTHEVSYDVLATIHGRGVLPNSIETAPTPSLAEITMTAIKQTTPDNTFVVDAPPLGYNFSHYVWPVPAGRENVERSVKGRGDAASSPVVSQASAATPPDHSQRHKKTDEEDEGIKLPDPFTPDYVGQVVDGIRKMSDDGRDKLFESVGGTETIFQDYGLDPDKEEDKIIAVILDHAKSLAYNSIRRQVLDEVLSDLGLSSADRESLKKDEKDLSDDEKAVRERIAAKVREVYEKSRGEYDRKVKEYVDKTKKDIDSWRRQGILFPDKAADQDEGDNPRN